MTETHDPHAMALAMLAKRFGSQARAMEWYEGCPIVGFGGMTAKQLVEAGWEDSLWDHFAGIDAGIFA